jgi:hypothetical protein
MSQSMDLRSGLSIVYFVIMVTGLRLRFCKSRKFLELLNGASYLRKHFA